MPRAMCTFDDLGRSVVAPNPFDEGFIWIARALCDKDVAGAAQVAGRLAQRPARQEVLVPKWRLPINQDNVQPMLQMQILQSVIKKKRVSLQFPDREKAAFYPIFI